MGAQGRRVSGQAASGRRRAVKVGWFPGPAGAGWVEAGNKGFLDAVKGTAIEVLEPKYGDTGKEVQLEARRGRAAGQSRPRLHRRHRGDGRSRAWASLRDARPRQDRSRPLAFYMTPGVYEGIKRGRILAAPADSMVIQGRIAIDQAVRHPGRQGLHQACRTEDLRCRPGQHQDVSTDDHLAAGRLQAGVQRELIATACPVPPGEGRDADRPGAAHRTTQTPHSWTRRGLLEAVSGRHGARRRSTSTSSAGEVHVLFGENGAGKSTLISILAGVYQPTPGRIALRWRGGRPALGARRRQHGIGAVFQEFSLVPTSDVSPRTSFSAASQARRL